MAKNKTKVYEIESVSPCEVEDCDSKIFEAFDGGDNRLVFRCKECARIHGNVAIFRGVGIVKESI